jgi:Ribosomal protein L7/L12 C-terminal domain
VIPTSEGSLPPDVIDALNKGRLIEAIKLLRTGSGLGLKEAKDIIDAHIRREGAPVGSQVAKEAAAASQRRMVADHSTAAGCSPGEVPRAQNSAWVIMVLAAAAFLGYYFLRGQ